MSHDFGRWKATAAEAGALLHYDRNIILGWTLTKGKFYIKKGPIETFVSHHQKWLAKIGQAPSPSTIWCDKLGSKIFKKKKIIIEKKCISY